MPIAFHCPSGLGLRASALAAALLVSAVALAGALAAPAPPPAFRCLQAAYPDAVAGLEPDPAGPGRLLVRLADGTRLVFDDGRPAKTFDERLETADIEDLFFRPYPLGPLPPGSAPTDDPGRVRSEALLGALYGRSPAEVKRALAAVPWLPRRGGRPVLFNARQGAAAALRRVAAELEGLPAPLLRYLIPPAGTFRWRRIHGTTRLSAHAFGIAIDLPVAESDYWRWAARAGSPPRYRNRIPAEIVAVFERHGFIWGGKWLHYDTMHFEYRPELLPPACPRAPGAR